MEIIKRRKKKKKKNHWGWDNEAGCEIRDFLKPVLLTVGETVNNPPL
jgi:hypothetical protein